jgi:pyrroloquinoline quinone biosynthesis protein B
MLLALASCAQPSESPARLSCEVSLVVLGVAQDAGKPQLGRPDDPAWDDPSRRRLASALALVDRRGGTTRRWLFEATPDIREQLQRLDRIAPVAASPGLEGVLLTHAHIGHYAGLIFFGKESAATGHLAVYAMPRMAEFLAKNGPWSQLVKTENVILAIMADGEVETLAEGLFVTPISVPHRDEFSETVGFRIEGPTASALFVPDIDRFEDWETRGVRVEDEIAKASVAFLDATFYSGDELPGRDLAAIPHPFASKSIERFAPLAAEERAKIRFIHFNHTNPLNDPESEESRAVAAAGLRAAREGEEICL